MIQHKQTHTNDADAWKFWLKPPLVGERVLALYRESPVPAYHGNPLIEALPPIRSPDELKQLAPIRPPITPRERKLPPHERKHCVQSGLKLFVPLSCFYPLEEHISLSIRGGYAQRRVEEPRFWPTSLEQVEKYSFEQRASGIFLPTAHHGYLVGVSGMGKTITVERILLMYPQAIAHATYKGKNMGFVQLVWLKLDCPADASVKGLCVNIIHALDLILGTDYVRRYLKGKIVTVDHLMPLIARLATLHCLGLLIIDEIQHLRPAFTRGGSQAMLNFFVNLSNSIGVPILLVGTFAALPLFDGEFRQMRRMDGHGPFAWLPMKPGKSWDAFTKELWNYQYLEKPVDWEPGLPETLRGETYGIPDYAVKVFLAAQIRGITNGMKSLNRALITSVAKDSLQLSRKVLDAMRNDDWTEVEYPDDLPPLDWGVLYQRASTPERAALQSQDKEQTEKSESSNSESMTAKPCHSDGTKTGTTPQPDGKNSAGDKQPQTIMGIVATAKERDKNKTSHQALKDAGLVRDLTLILESKAA